MSRTTIEDRDLDVASLKVVSDFVLIEIIEQSETAGGIVVVTAKEGSRSECCIGKVIKVGTGEFQPKTGRTIPLQFKVGEIVCCMEYMGERIETGGKKYRMVRAHGIWTKLKLRGKPELMDIEAIHPVTDHILLKVREEHTTKGGIILSFSGPTSASSLADVVEIGEGRIMAEAEKPTPLEVKKGETVAFMSCAGAVIHMRGVEYRLATEGDIVAVVEGI